MLWTVSPLILAVAGMVGFHLASIRQPLSQEELTWWLQLPQTILATGRPLSIDGTAWNDHPPLYALLLAGVFAGFGVGEVQARALGLGLGLLTMVAFYNTVCILQKAHAPEVPLAPLALSLYVLHPLVLQSTLLVEPDTTLGPLAAGLFGLYAVRLRNLGARREATFGGLLIAFLLWIKFYDALLLAAALVFVVTLNEGWHAALTRVGRVVALGLVLFALTWIPVSHALRMDATGPLTYLFDALRSRSLDVSLTRVVRWPRETAEAALWASPVLMLVVPLVALACLRPRTRRPDLIGVQLLAAWGVAQLVVPLLFVGPLYGFPKYQALALVLLLRSWRSTRRRGGTPRVGRCGSLSLWARAQACSSIPSWATCCSRRESTSRPWRSISLTGSGRPAVSSCSRSQPISCCQPRCWAAGPGFVEARGVSSCLRFWRRT